MIRFLPKCRAGDLNHARVERGLVMDRVLLIRLENMAIITASYLGFRHSDVGDGSRQEDVTVLGVFLQASRWELGIVHCCL